MANHLTFAQMTALRAATVGSLKPSDIKDIRDALDRIAPDFGTDANRNLEQTLNALFANRVG